MIEREGRVEEGMGERGKGAEDGREKGDNWSEREREKVDLAVLEVMNTKLQRHNFFSTVSKKTVLTLTSTPSQEEGKEDKKQNKIFEQEEI